MWHGFATVTTTLAGFGLTWLVQSSILLILGLAAGRLLKRSGPAVQSAVYRTTFAAVLVCPAASAVLAARGYDRLTLRVSSSAFGEPVEPGSVVVTPRALDVTK